MHWIPNWLHDTMMVLGGIDIAVFLLWSAAVVVIGFLWFLATLVFRS